MKINKIFSIDLELAQKLAEEDSASKIVNELLKEHYSK